MILQVPPKKGNRSFHSIDEGLFVERQDAHTDHEEHMDEMLVGGFFFFAVDVNVMTLFFFLDGTRDIFGVNGLIWVLFLVT